VNSDAGARAALTGEPAGTQASRDPTFTGFFTLVATAMSCAVLALAIPRAIVPNTLPALTLNPVEVGRALERDRGLAEQALAGPRVEEVRQLYLDQGVADVEAPQTYDAERMRKLSFFSETLSPKERDTLRAQATERAMASLFEQADAPQGKERTGLLGHFATQLIENGLRRQDGLWLAPELSVRAAYKIRWNLVHSRPTNEGLLPIERQAFEGFVALHGRAQSPRERAGAAHSFYEAGGKRAAEANAVWLYQGGLTELGLALLARAQEQRDELRTRNMRLGMLLALQDAVEGETGDTAREQVSDESEHDQAAH
jgi:hypothetical protein